jgi:RNA polymerase sigma factor (sigma-70 family)
MNDWWMLRRYLEENSQTSFTRLVDKHMKLVYWTCRRDLRDAHLAEDASQAVFILLAQKAAGIRSGVSIAGWLFNTARLVSKNVNRREATRRRYEEQAISNMEQSGALEQTWSTIEPDLNDALAGLNPSDLEAVLLRFCDGLSLQEIADEIGTSEGAARKRVSRAVERLRQQIGRRGATVSSTALEMLLGEHAENTVSAETHSAVLQAIQRVLAGRAPLPAGHHYSLVFKKGAGFIMQASTRKILITCATVALLGAGAAIPLSIWSASRASTFTGMIGYTGPSSYGPTPGAPPTPTINAIDTAYRTASAPANVADMGCAPGNAGAGCVVQFQGGNTLSSDLANAISEHLFQMLRRELDDVTVTETVRPLQLTAGGVIATVDCRIEGKTCMDEILYGSELVKKGTKITFDPTFQDQWEQINGQWLNVKRTWLAPSNRALKLYPLEDAPGAIRTRP